MIPHGFNRGSIRCGPASKAGKSFKRARVISEPVTDYQRWVHKDAHLFVEAGEDIRWMPKASSIHHRVSGNDFWLFDDELAVFLIFSGNGLVLDRLATYRS